MKVVHIVACQLHSGAGRAIRSLHENLLSKRIESHVLGRIEFDLPKELNPHPVPLWKKLPVSLGNRIVRWRLKRRYQTTLHNFHPVGFGLNLHRSKIYREADINPCPVRWRHNNGTAALEGAKKRTSSRHLDIA